MPQYDYRCSPCNFEFEQRVPIDNRDVVGCPNCGAFADRLPGAPMFSVAGKGAHQNEYPVGRHTTTNRTSVKQKLRARRERE